MMDEDQGLAFDFEGGLDAVSGAGVPGGPPQPNVPGGAGVGQAAPRTAQQMRRSYRQTVCRHWLRGLCMKGNDCGFLHQYDKARMPLCRFFARFGECREPDCIYKHSTEDIKECNMYKLGFCPNGPECRYRHEKLPGPPPPVEQHLAKFQQRYTPKQPMNNEGAPRNQHESPQNGPGKPSNQKMMSAASPLPYGFPR